MSTPRFEVGQVVVIIPPHTNAGHVGVVEDMGWSDNWDSRRSGISGWVGWGYQISSDHRLVLECRLRPFDPPATWDDEDMVWKPETLKEAEPA